MRGVGCGVWGVGCGVWGVGCGVWGVGCGVWGVGCGVGGVGCGVWGVGWGGEKERSERERRREVRGRGNFKNSLRPSSPCSLSPPPPCELTCCVRRSIICASNARSRADARLPTPLSFAVASGSLPRLIGNANVLLNRANEPRKRGTTNDTTE